MPAGKLTDNQEEEKKNKERRLAATELRVRPYGVRAQTYSNFAFSNAPASVPRFSSRNLVMQPTVTGLITGQHATCDVPCPAGIWGSGLRRSGILCRGRRGSWNARDCQSASTQPFCMYGASSCMRGVHTISRYHSTPSVCCVSSKENQACILCCFPPHD